MTKTSVRRVANDSLPDFLKVLNADRAQAPDYEPLTVQDLRKAARMRLVSLDGMLLGLEGSVPTSTGRLLIKANHEAVLCDLAVMPGHRSAGEALIEQVLKTCREGNAESIVAWISENEFRFSDILSSYTFEPRRVRVRARAALREQPANANSGGLRVVESDQAPGQEESSSPFEFGRGDARDLADIIDDMENRWQTMIVGSNQESGPIIVGRMSGSDRRISELHVNEELVMRDSAEALSPELVKEILARLYRNGVREVRCEVDSDTRLKTPLLETGFVPDLTLFQFVLELAHEQSR